MSEREKKDKRIVKMELMYTSTRNANEKVTASQAILKGLAEDGGLFVPEQLPTLDKTVDELAGMTYQVTPGWAEARTAWWNMLQQVGSGADVQTAVDEFVGTANAAAAN